MIKNRLQTIARFTIEEKLERLRIRRGDPLGTDYSKLLASNMPEPGDTIEFPSDRFTDKGPATGTVIDWKTTTDGNYVTVKFGDGQESFSWDDIKAEQSGNIWMAIK